MTFQEIRNLVNIGSTLLIAYIYFWWYADPSDLDKLSTEGQMEGWAELMLNYILVFIIAKISILIIFHIASAIVTRETPPDPDEREKLIEMKAQRRAQWVFHLGLVVGIFALAYEEPIKALFTSLIIGGIAAEILENIIQLYFHRRGV